MQVITRKEAAQQGLSRYFTGKPCHRGHISERYMKGKCIECSKYEKKHGVGKRAEAKAKGLVHFSTGKICKKCGTDKKYVSSGDCVSCHQSKGKANKKIWREKNREYYLAQAKGYRDRAKQHIKEYNAEYRARTVEKRAAYNKQHRLENLEHYRLTAQKYRQEKPYMNAAYQATRRSIKMKATPVWSDYERIKLKYIERDMMRQLTGLDFHVDHIVPLQGENVCGLHIAENLRVILARDNLSKSNKHA